MQIRRYKFKRKCNLDNLTRYDIYSVQSLADDMLIYMIDGIEFAMIRDEDGMRWNLNETPEVASRITVEEIKNEILDIYNDVKDLCRMQVNYWEVKK